MAKAPPAGFAAPRGAGADGMALARHPERKDEDGRGGACLAPVRPGLLGA